MTASRREHKVTYGVYTRLCRLNAILCYSMLGAILQRYGAFKCVGGGIYVFIYIHPDRVRWGTGHVYGAGRIGPL